MSLKTLLRLETKKFGAPNSDTEVGVRAIKDMNTLERTTDTVQTASSWQELLKY